MVVLSTRVVKLDKLLVGGSIFSCLRGVLFSPNTSFNFLQIPVSQNLQVR